jgi:hypothetical protein
MPTYLILWETHDRALLGSDPNHQLDLITKLVDVVKDQVQSGVFREIRTFIAPGTGYAITGEITGDKLHDELARLSYQIAELFRYQIFELTSSPTLDGLVQGLTEGMRAGSSL